MEMLLIPLSIVDDMLMIVIRMLERDVGWYEAVATNEHGQARQRVRLELAEYPTFIRRPEETVVLQRRTARIEARVTGVPYPDIKWYKDWQPIAASSRIKVCLLNPSSPSMGDYYYEESKDPLHDRNFSM